MTEITPLTILIVAVLIFITVIFMLYRKIYTVTYVLVNWSFFIALFFAFLSLLIPVAFETPAELFFDQTNLSSQLKQADGVITDVVNAPEETVNSITDFFGINDEEEEMSDDGFESNLYEEFVDFVATVIRFLTFIFSVITMLLLIYIRYAFSGLYESVRAMEKIDELEDKVEKLEKLLDGISLENPYPQAAVPQS